MEVVSEKTGYPVETLEPSMDMESDLGINSIKRVEILGAMQSLYPDLPKLKPEELAELRTLGQIVEHIGAKLGTSTKSSVPVIVPAIMPNCTCSRVRQSACFRSPLLVLTLRHSPRP